MSQHNPTPNRHCAIVTGASSGIGYEFARQLAEAGCTIIAVSNEYDRLEALSEDFKVRYSGVETYLIFMDLARAEAAEELYARVAELGLKPDILINNAGMFFFEQFQSVDTARIETMLQLHVGTTTRLCRLFGADMCRRGEGYILNMSSICAFMPNPGLHLYAATKEYVRSFTKSIWYDLRPYGVSATALCPGGVATSLYNFPPRLVRRLVKIGIFTTPERLARRGLKAMFSRRRVVVTGFGSRFGIALVAVLPSWVRFKVIARVYGKSRHNDR